MPVGSGITRGRNPAVNAYTMLDNVATVADNTNANVAELNCGVNAGVNLIVWGRQVQGAIGATFTVQFLWRIDPPTDTEVWRNVVDPYLVPVAGTVSRLTVQHAARRYRLNVSAPLGSGGVQVEFHFGAWAM